MACNKKIIVFNFQEIKRHDKNPLMLQFVTLSVATAPLNAVWYIKRN
jgi:hypothetical protein